MLWPEPDETRARRALSQALYALRRELGADMLRAAPRLVVDPAETARAAHARAYQGALRELARLAAAADRLA